MREGEVEQAAELVDKRNMWRRAEDVRNKMIIIGLTALIFAGGIAWETANKAVDGKVDKAEFNAHVISEEKRFLVDSIQKVIWSESLRRIEAKQDSTNSRLSRFICKGAPDYCK